MKLKREEEHDDTEKIRTALYFLQFVENKIIKKQVYHLSSQDMPEIKGWPKFLSLYLK